MLVPVALIDPLSVLITTTTVPLIETPGTDEATAPSTVPVNAVGVSVRATEASAISSNGSTASPKRSRASVRVSVAASAVPPSVSTPDSSWSNTAMATGVLAASTLPLPARNVKKSSPSDVVGKMISS